LAENRVQTPDQRSHAFAYRHKPVDYDEVKGRYEDTEEYKSVYTFALNTDPSYENEYDAYCRHFEHNKLWFFKKEAGLAMVKEASTLDPLFEQVHTALKEKTRAQKALTPAHVEAWSALAHTSTDLIAAIQKFFEQTCGMEDLKMAQRVAEIIQARAGPVGGVAKATPENRSLRQRCDAVASRIRQKFPVRKYGSLAFYRQRETDPSYKGETIEVIEARGAVDCQLLAYFVVKELKAEGVEYENITVLSGTILDRMIDGKDQRPGHTVVLVENANERYILALSAIDRSIFSGQSNWGVMEAEEYLQTTSFEMDSRGGSTKAEGYLKYIEEIANCPVNEIPKAFMVQEFLPEYQGQEIFISSQVSANDKDQLVVMFVLATSIHNRQEKYKQEVDRMILYFGFLPQNLPTIRKVLNASNKRRACLVLLQLAQQQPNLIQVNFDVSNSKGTLPYAAEGFGESLAYLILDMPDNPRDIRQMQERVLGLVPGAVSRGKSASDPDIERNE
ncbi:MAG: hypothetical protein WCH62_09410, partial [Candidatus Omnitrophota bacterium]